MQMIRTVLTKYNVIEKITVYSSVDFVSICHASVNLICEQTLYHNLKESLKDLYKYTLTPITYLCGIAHFSWCEIIIVS